MFRQHFRNVVMVCLAINLTGGAFLYPGQVFAASFIVNSTSDGVDAHPGDGICATSGGQCTLRAAIMETNALGGNNIITLPAGIYTLTIAGQGEDAAAQGDLDITRGNLTITGAGSATTVIDGGNLDRLFDLFSGTNVKMSGFTLRNGKGDAADMANVSQTDGGGAIRAYESNLTLTGVTVNRNTSASNGGAIAFNYSRFGRPAPATLNISGSVLLGNVAQLNGGGIIIGGGSTLNLDSSTIISNTAQAKNTAQVTRYGGGGLYVGQGYTPIGGTYLDTQVNITNSSFENNFTSDKNASGQITGEAWGGAIHLEKSTVVIEKSAFTANKAEGQFGGGIYDDSADLTIRTSTFSGNAALDEGGALYAQSVPFLAISGDTFANNQAMASSLGGGGAISGSGQSNNGLFIIADSIFRNNQTAGSGGALKIGANTTVSYVEVSGNTASANGGGIVVLNSNADAPTIISHATISGNVAEVRGGGIENGAVLQLSNSIVRNNSTNQSEGGGISNYQAFSLVITNTDIVSNVAAGNGGGIFDRHGTFGANGNDPSTSLLTDVFIDGNHAGGDGGGVYSLVSIKFVKATISNNVAKSSGGGILTFSDFNLSSQRQLYPVQLDLTNVTLNGNSAQDGGAIYQNGGVSKVNNVTIAGNTAITTTTGGGGIYQDSGNPGDALNPNTITVQNTIIAKNTASTGPDCANTITSAGNNLLGNNKDCTFAAAASDKVGMAGSPLDPVLDNLADNGGATKTMALQTGSPAIDAGNPATCANTDQRDAPRVNACDMGAFEFGSTPATPTPVPTETATPTQTPQPTATPTATSTPGTVKNDLYLPWVKR